MNSKCPICQKSDYRIIGDPKTNQLSAKLVNQDFKVVQCNECSAYYVTPRINFTREEWGTLYNSEYFADQTEWLLKKRREELLERFDTVQSQVNKNVLNFLDIGSGEGKALIEADSRGWIAEGIDIVDLRLEEAKKPSIKFIKDEFLQHNFGNNSYDFIYMDSVLEHVMNPLDYLNKMKELLNPGGVIYIGVPNEDCLFNSVRKLVFTLIGRKNISVKIKPFDDPYHVIGFNKESLHYAFNKLGFKIVKFQNIGRKFDFLSSSPMRKAFWINLVFRFPIEYIGMLLKKDIYYAAYISK